MPSATNSEIDCNEVMEEPGTMTCVKAKKNEPLHDWSKEAEAIADAMAKLSAEEQRLMMDRIAMALGVRDGKYVGAEQPIPQWAPYAAAAAEAGKK